MSYGNRTTTGMRRGHKVHPSVSIKEVFTLKEHKSNSGVIHTYYQSNLRKDKFQQKYLKRLIK